MEEVTVKVLNQQRSLEEWLLKTSITLTQVNGQRKYGGPPPDWSGPTPGPGCEVFISNIPRDVYENRLIPLFCSVAPLYEFRLMMNFSGHNRGFAYAKYGNSGSAAAAVRTLHLYPLQDGVRLTVRKSTEKRQLYLGELPSDIGRKELFIMLQLLSDGVEGVTIKPAGPKGRDACAIVQYSSHYAASMAKKVLVQALKKQYGISISVRWMSGSTKTKPEEAHEESPLTLPSLKPNHSPVPPRFLLTRPSLNDPLPPPSPSRLLNPQPFSKAVGGLAPLALNEVLAQTPPSDKAQPWNTTSQPPFSKAVGGPVPLALDKMLPQTPLSNKVQHWNAVSQLQWLCQLQGLGVPLYDFRYSHMGPDGFLHFTYRVALTGLPVPFCGAIQVLPATSAKAMEAEIRRAIAEQVLAGPVPVLKP